MDADAAFGSSPTAPNLVHADDVMNFYPDLTHEMYPPRKINTTDNVVSEVRTLPQTMPRYDIEADRPVPQQQAPPPPPGPTIGESISGCFTSCTEGMSSIITLETEHSLAFFLMLVMEVGGWFLMSQLYQINISMPSWLSITISIAYVAAGFAVLFSSTKSDESGSAVVFFFGCIGAVVTLFGVVALLTKNGWQMEREDLYFIAAMMPITVGLGLIFIMGDDCKSAPFNVVLLVLAIALIAVGGVLGFYPALLLPVPEGTEGSMWGMGFVTLVLGGIDGWMWKVRTDFEDDTNIWQQLVLGVATPASIPAMLCAIAVIIGLSGG
eukprot:gnl/Dysnectes_brevis/3456_a4377_1118.p1 GENE.gnl/Dysnectes_brevis/3456_a4377_1118~~gnl/Dysnectes_brevis/3456_a4377_1118.p1  ORF type:complete len:341 (+),score=60.52 gnl/Dysnectes_brevis/3456_a4377_1118:54-1025(+)